MTPLRKKLASHLVAAQQTAALLTTFNEIDMSAVIALRHQHRDGFHERHGVGGNRGAFGRIDDLDRAAIEAAIGNASPSSQTRLRRLQWRIDQERRLARTPMGACIRLSNLMWRSVLGPGGLQERFGELQRLLGGEQTVVDNREFVEKRD